MHNEVVWVEADTEQVAPSYPERLCQASHPGPLVSVDCVEGVVAAGEGANFDHNRRDMVASNDVDFTTGDNHVPGDDVETLLAQEEAGKEFAKLSRRQPS